MPPYFDEDDRLQFFYDTYQPIRLGYGTQYHGVTQSDLYAYTRPISWYIYKPHTNKAASTKQLTDFLANQWPNQIARDALMRMREVISTPGWGPDMLVKILPDMDEAFFNGLLRSRVQVTWEDEFTVQFSTLPIPRFAYLLGATGYDHNNDICYIRLNRSSICERHSGSRKLMLQVLVHELVVSTRSVLPIQMS